MKIIKTLPIFLCACLFAASQSIAASLSQIDINLINDSPADSKFCLR